jgi:uncharacterized protein
MAEAPGQAAPCSICGKPVDPSYRPFCSRRCADLDLHRWLNGAYVIAGESDPDEADDAPEASSPGSKRRRDDF